MKICWLLIASFMYLTNINANHVLGGSIRYECLGFSNQAEDSIDIKIEMQVFYQCTTTSIESSVSIFVYERGNTTYDLIDTIVLPPYAIEEIEASNNDCVDVFFPCTQKARYATEIKLRKTENEYLVTHQECCRDNNLTNIVEPHKTGFTLYTEITAQAQQSCNSSPSFPTVPARVLCAGQLSSIDFGVHDMNDHELIYELCTPLKGGGPEGGLIIGNPLGCNGVTPFPACLPPYEEVAFIPPEYTAQYPFGQSAILQFDANGILEIKPLLLGHFVFGICISEYQNGELIGNLRIDYEIIVKNCDIEIIASLENAPINSNYIEVETCDDLQITLNNTSTNPENVKSFLWVLQNEHTVDTLYDWHPTLELSDYGIYEGFLVLNAETCSDTAKFIINASPKVTANFDYSAQLQSDGIFELEFQNQSENAVYWTWSLDEGQFSIKENPILSDVLFESAMITLIAENEWTCTDTLEKRVDLETPISFFLPNAFTPNYDGINDIFIGVGITNYIKDFQLNVWNRWGEIVFSTQNPAIGWNGFYKNGGTPCTNGVYTWQFSFKNSDNQVIQEKGLVTLIR